MPHADLGRGGGVDAVELEAPAHPARVAESPLSDALVHQVEVRVEMDHSDGALDGVVHAAHDWIEERVLAADDDRHASGSNARRDGVGTRIDRCDQVVRDHGDVTAVDGELLRHVDETLAVHVVDAAILHAHPHPLERFADPWWRVPRAGPPERRAAVERDAPQVERAWHARMVSSLPVEPGYRVARNLGISEAGIGRPR